MSASVITQGQFVGYLLKELQRIRQELGEVENCEDGMEMIDIAQRLACDIETLEETVEWNL